MFNSRYSSGVIFFSGNQLLEMNNSKKTLYNIMSELNLRSFNGFSLKTQESFLSTTIYL